jgi:glycerol-3-phosphate cytidylyltransferase
MLKVVLTYGTFDLFHIGHLNLLRRARSFGDRLVVGVSTDKFNLGKGKTTAIKFENRLEIIRSIRFVDEAFPEMSWDQKCADIRKYHVETFVMGDDWAGKFDFLESQCRVIYLPRTTGISSSSLKADLRKGMITSPKDMCLSELHSSDAMGVAR